MPSQVFWRIGWELFEGEAFEGEDAIQKMRAILSPLPQCVHLAKEVGTLFGSDFMLSTYPTSDQAIFAAYTGEVDDKVHIRLGLNSRRVPEALTHELLHGDLLRRGFPWLDVKENEHYCTLNYVHHALMFPQYQELGLDPGKFFGPTPVLNKAEVTDLLGNSNADFPFWCRQWCGDWIGWKLTGDDKNIKWMETEWGRIAEKYPQFTKTVARMKDWFDRGDYHDQTGFENSYNELVSLMEMPPVALEDWFRVEKGEQRPVRRRSPYSEEGG